EYWFIRMLDESCPAEQRTAFARWCAADPAHARAYADVQRLWADTAAAASRPDLRAEAHAAATPRAAASRRRWFVPALAGSVAALLLVVGLGWGMLMHTGSPAPLHYATATGQLRTVRLPDGSSLVLDTDSEVTVAYRPRLRSVTLVRGRALFRVHHDAARPFQVHVDAGVVTDLGTVFQVSRGAKGADVVLIRGAVSVANVARGTVKPQSVALRPNEALSISRAGVIGVPRSVLPTAVDAWTHGDVVASDWPLSRLVADMNRYSTTKLVLGEPDLAEVRISGVFHVGDQQSLIRMLRLGWSIEAQRAAPGQLLLTRIRASATSRQHAIDR
ncbi:MAG TPA: FecR domain-containing protein, partial [Rhodanobacteraceae bacterium]|nr:FecR domain-containing protein [Rhodanobacteraceae bacterium]